MNAIKVKSYDELTSEELEAIKTNVSYRADRFVYVEERDGEFYVSCYCSLGAAISKFEYPHYEKPDDVFLFDCYEFKYKE